MPQISQNYFRAAAIFLLAGIAMGLQMSISGNHNVTGAHAHLGLLGWVSCAIFGTYFALNREKAAAFRTVVQFWVVVVSCAVMSGGLCLLLLGYTAAEPFVAVGSLVYSAGAALFVWIVFAPAAGTSTSHDRVHG